MLLVGLVACSGDDAGPEPQVVDDSTPSQVTNPDAAPDDGTLSDEPLADVPNPCELVPADEVADVTDQDVTSSAYQQLGPGSVSCNHLVDDEGTVGAAVGITVEQAAAELETYGALDDTEAVDDLGDGASWSPTLGTLAVLDGDTLVTVNLLILDDDPEDLRAQATELAVLALDRL